MEELLQRLRSSVVHLRKNDWNAVADDLETLLDMADDALESKRDI